MLDELSLDSFTRVMNTRFRVNADSHPVDLLLIEATDLSSSERHEAFSVVFRGPRESLLRQAIYRLEHDGLGGMDVFLVPIGMEEDGILYQAIFNRIRD